MRCLVGRSYSVTACVGRGDHDDDRDVRLEDQRRTDSVVDRKDSAKLESAVHKAVHRSRIGWPDHIVKSQRSLEHRRCSSVQALPKLSALLLLGAYAVSQQILVVLRPDMMLVELVRSSHHCCSSLHAVAVAP